MQLRLGVLLLFSIYCTYVLAQDHPRDDSVQACTNKKRIAIIGSGIAGASSAYFVHQRLPNEALEVVVFEANDTIGGRLRHINIHGVNLEVGGGVYFYQNFFIRNFTVENNFTEYQPEGKSVGIWGGDEFVFQSSSWKLISIIKALWRYGLSPRYAEQFALDVKDQFLKLYPLLEENTYETVEEIYNAINLTSAFAKSFETCLKEQGVGKLLIDGFASQHSAAQGFIDEIPTALTKINYGQNASANCIAGCLGLIGGSNAFYSPREGFASVIERILQHSGASVRLSTKVNSIQPTVVDGVTKYTVKSTNKQTNEVKEEVFDAVIIGTPLEFAGIELHDINAPPMREYQITHVTFVAGKLQPKYFGLSPEDELPDLIGTIESPKIPFSSIGLRASTNGTKIYKIFSRQQLTDSLLDSLFAEKNYVYRWHWCAYPKLPPISKFPPLILHDNLYYVNAMESAISVIEVEAISARNIVNLLVNRLK